MMKNVSYLKLPSCPAHLLCISSTLSGSEGNAEVPIEPFRSRQTDECIIDCGKLKFTSFFLQEVWEVLELLKISI